MKVGARDGNWVCLKNLHLSVTFLPTLERELDKLYDDCHDSFRLWLTTEKRNSISRDLINRSFKVIYDPPSGLKEKVKQTYAQWEELPALPKGCNNYVLKAKLCFILAWTHAILQERGSFGVHGWRNKYEFNSGDLLAARNIIETFHHRSDAVDIIKYFLIKFIYGGKISNVCDEVVLNAYIELYFNENVVEGYCDLFPGFRFKDPWDDQSQHRSIRDIPDIESPFLFGLPNNIMGSVQTDLAVSMMQDLQKLYKMPLRHKSNLPTWYEAAASVINHWKSISRFQNELEVNCSAKDWPEDPFYRFIRNEISLGDTLFRTVSSSINLLERAMNDNVNSDSILLQQLRDSIVNGNVPGKWKELWNGPTEIKTWMADMIQKKKSIDMYQTPNVLFQQKVSMNLTDFFNTSAFICSLKQKVAKESNYAMDDVTLFAQFESPQDDGYTKENASISICGLYLSGCVLIEKFDGSFIVEPVKSSTPEYEKSPPIKLSFQQHQSSLQMTDTYLIPVYSNILSEEILFHVSVGCEKTSVQSWILTGVALYLEC